MGYYSEVGHVPGTYRIIDLYCLKEMLNQIVRCHVCQVDAGFSLFQTEQDATSMSFYSILDILCLNCQKKTCFGTSILRKESSEDSSIMTSEADIDIVVDSLIQNNQVKEKLWSQMFSHPSQDEQLNIILDSDRFSIIDTAPSVTDNPTDSTINDTESEQKTEDKLTSLKPPLATKPKYQCQHCSKLFQKHYNLSQHIRIHTGETLDCSKCNRKFKDKSSLNKHISDVHEQKKPYFCVKCDKTFKRKTHLMEHKVVHSADYKFSCDICGKKFGYKNAMQRHKLIHTESEIIKCLFCGKDFKGKYSYKKHVKNFHTAIK